MIVIHCSATRCDRDYPFERLDKDHRSRGWNGCGYHYYVTRDGRVTSGAGRIKWGRTSVRSTTRTPSAFATKVDWIRRVVTTTRVPRPRSGAWQR